MTRTKSGKRAGRQQVPPPRTANNWGERLILKIAKDHLASRLLALPYLLPALLPATWASYSKTAGSAGMVVGILLIIYGLYRLIRFVDTVTLSTDNKSVSRLLGEYLLGAVVIWVANLLMLAFGRNLWLLSV